MGKNYNASTGQYRFIKVKKGDILDFVSEDISNEVFFDKLIVETFIHIEENLYEYDGNFYIPQNYI